MSSVPQSEPDFPAEDDAAEPATLPPAAALTEAAAAAEMAERFGEHFRWDYDRGFFRVYNVGAGIWTEDFSGRVARYARSIARSAWQRAAGKEAVKHATRISSAAGIESVLRLARSEPGVPIRATELDADPWLLNVKNGVVDLRTGRLFRHTPAGLMTKLAPVNFVPTATCPMWDDFLVKITDGRSALAIYLQRLSGMFLTGDVSVQEFYIFHGCGANGKSVFLDTISGIVGDYGGIAPESLLTARPQSNHPTDLASVVGKRLVIGSETESGASLRLQLVKRLTGDSTLTARFMRQDFFTFPRTFKFVLVTNNRPHIPERSEATWRRIRLVPFDVVIPANERDPRLLAKLREEWPGILAWMVRGCADWRRDGLATPAEVAEATSAYAAEQDDIGEFVSALCAVGAGQFTSRDRIYKTYSDWPGGRRKMQRSDFYEALRRIQGVSDDQRRVCGKPVRGFSGIGLTNLSDALRDLQGGYCE